MHDFFYLALGESLIDVSNLESCRCKLRFHKVFVNTEGRIWVFFDDTFEVVPMAQSSQFLAVKIVAPQLDTPFVAIFVHASCESP